MKETIDRAGILRSDDYRPTLHGGQASGAARLDSF